MSRILHVIHSADPRGGGPIEGVRQRGKVLRQMGHTVEIASLDGPDLQFEDELRLHRLGPGRGGYGYSQKMAPWLTRHAKDYDFVIVNGIWQYHGLAVHQSLRKLSMPYFVFPHGMLDPWFRNNRLKHIKKSIFWRLAEHRVLSNAAAVLFTSEGERVSARDSFKPYRIREKVVRYGTAGPTGHAAEQADHFRKAFPDTGSQPYLLFLSRIHPKKGCDLLIRAFADVLAEASDLKLVIAGPDQVGWKLELQALCNTLGLQNRVVWPGMLVGDLKWGAYHGCDAFVLPSHQENFGIVVAEALSCGKPVLITNKVNIWQEILENNAGFAADDTFEGIASLLRNWNSQSSEQRSELQESALRCFADHFEVTNSAESLLSVLRGDPK